MANIKKQLQVLRDIIERATTGDGEREAAKRAMERLLKKANSVDSTETVTSSWFDFSRVYGSKYASMGGKYMSATEIAALIRADVKIALKVARAAAEPGAIATIDPLAAMPSQIKVTVKKEEFSGGRSIDIIMRDIPEDWGYSMQRAPYSDEMRSMPSPELRAAAKALKAILDAYNYDGSRPEVDHYDVNYYGHVRTVGGLLLA